jgi:hypothetical protein
LSPIWTPATRPFSTIAFAAGISVATSTPSAFRLLGHPRDEIAERQHPVAVILEHRRHDRQPHLGPVGEQVHVVGGDRGADGAAALAPVRQQLGHRARIHDGARDPVRADACRLLEHRDRDLAQLFARRALRDGGIVIGDEVREMDRTREPRGARAHELHVEFEELAFHAHSFPACAAAASSAACVCASSQRSASIAAMQPVPAAVTA